jgi:hypothetical protein
VDDLSTYAILTVKTPSLEDNQVIGDIVEEEFRQDEKWGEQHHPDGTENTPESRWQRDFDRALCQDAARDGTVTWLHILREEVSEAFAEDDPVKLREELVQVAAVAARWVKDIDSREAPAKPTGLDQVRDAVRSARGGEAPAAVRGFA